MEELKRVTFKVANAIKEAGYPQDYNNAIYSEDGHIHVNITYEYRLYVKEHKLGYDAPSVLEVWLWLWQNKGICIEIKDNCYYVLAKVKNQRFHGDNPEDAIIAAIEYLVDNNLIK